MSFFEKTFHNLKKSSIMYITFSSYLVDKVDKTIYRHLVSMIMDVNRNELEWKRSDRYMYKDVAKRMLAMILMCCMISSMPNLSLLAAQTDQGTAGEELTEQPESMGLETTEEMDESAAESYGLEEPAAPLADGDNLLEENETPYFVDGSDQIENGGQTSIAMGSTKQLQCVGEDGQELTGLSWATSNSAALTVSNGLLSAVTTTAVNDWVTITVSQDGKEIASVRVAICKSLESSDITVQNATTEAGKTKLEQVQRYTGSGVEPAVTLLDGATPVNASNTTFKVTYNNNTELTKTGGAEAVIEGTGQPGGYTGRRTVYFDIKYPFSLIESNHGIPESLPSQTRSALTGELPSVDGLTITGKDGVVLTQITKTAADQNEDGYYVEVTIQSTNDKADIKVAFSGFYYGETVYNDIPLVSDISECTVTVEPPATGTTYVYTGAEIKPGVTVKHGDRPLTEDVEYTVSYENNINVSVAASEESKPVIVIKGKGQYGGTVNRKFDISQAQANQIFDVKNIKPAIYNKKKAETGIPPSEIEITNKNTGQPASQEDYELIYTNADKATGSTSATVTVKGKGNCTGEISSPYTINYADLTLGAYAGTENEITVTIENQDKIVYQGQNKQVRPTVKVQQGKGELAADLEEGKDYTLEYGTNTSAGVNAGSVKILSVSGGNYTGSREVNFDIKQFNMADFDAQYIDQTFGDQLYTGNQIKPNENGFAILTDGTDIRLQKDIDYTVEYGTNIDVGDGIIRFQAKPNSNCVGFKEITFVIYKQMDEASGITVEVSDQPYTGAAVKPEPVVKDDGKVISKDEQSPHYTVSYSTENPVEVGTYSITVSGDGKYYRGDISADYQIVPREMQDLEAQFKDPAPNFEYDYDGNPKKPEVKILAKDGSGLELPRNDFDVVWLNSAGEEENGSAGSCSIRITPKSEAAKNYNFGTDGALVLQYTILKREFVQDDSKFSVSLKTPANTIIYNGSEQKPEVTVTDKTLGSGKALSENDFMVSWSENINAGENTALITVTGIGNYQGTLTKNFTILPKDLSTVGAGNISIELADGKQYIFTGTGIVPEVTEITVDGIPLTTDDYELTSTAVNVGENNAFTINGKKNYTGSVASNGSQVSSPALFKIEQKPITDTDVIVAEIPNQALKPNGGAVTPSLSITYNGIKLESPKDFTVTYSNNDKIDNDDPNTPDSEKPTAHITGAGNFSGERDVFFHIRSSIEDAVIAGLDNNLSYRYAGPDGIRPKPTSVKLPDGTLLEENRDYYLEYENNVDAWGESNRDPNVRPTVRIIGKGQYGGEIKKYFKINVVQATKMGSFDGYSLSLTGNSGTVAFTGSPVAPPFNIIYRFEHPITNSTISYTLVEGKDYTMNTEQVDAATGINLYVGFTGNFFRSGSLLLKTYTISKKDIARSGDVTAESEENFDFHGQPVEPDVKVTDTKREAGGAYKPEGGGTYKLVEGKDYKIAYTNNTSPGTATYTITGQGNYTGTLRGTFYIKGDLKGAEVEFTKTTGPGENEYLFTGSRITPTFNVKIASGNDYKILNSRTDYDVQMPEDAIGFGEYTIRIIGKGAYVGAQLTATFKIVKRDLNDGVRIEVPGSVVFAGEGINVWPQVTMTLGSYKLTEGTDYTLEHEDQCWQSSSAAKKNYKLTLHAKEDSNFTGSVEKTYTIGDNLEVSIQFIDDDGNVITGKVSRTYTGESIQPKIRVTDDKQPGKVLIEGTDYGITYADDCINVGAKSIIIYGLADYTKDDYETTYCGSKTFNNAYTITPKNLGDNDITIEDILDQPYSAQQIKPEPAVTWGEKVLQAGNEFRFTYGTNRDAGDAAGTVTITGNGNFAGSKSKTFNITKKNLTDLDVRIDPIPNQLYIGGQDIKPVPTIKWGPDPSKPITLSPADYVVTYKQGEDEKSQDVGMVEMTISGAEKNYTGTITTTFEIVKVPLADVKAELLDTDSKDSYGYTGYQITPSVKLSYTSPNSKGEIVMTPELWGYEISYGQNQYVGTNGSITITAKPDGNCTGSKAISFKIERRKLTDETTIRLEPNEIPPQVLDPTNEVTGIEPEVKVIFYPGAGRDPYQLVPGTDCRIEYSNNKKVTTDAKITITGMGNFDGTLTRTFRITQDLTRYITSAEIDTTKPLIYNGQVQHPVLNLTFYTGVNLREGTDYELVYQRDGVEGVECKESGEYTVMIRGIGTYSGELGPYSFQIEKRALTPEMFHAEDQGYTGGPITPIVSGEDLERALEEGVDYVIGEVVNNINVGEVTVPIQAVETSNYKGSIEITFQIKPTNLLDNDYIDITGLEVMGELGELEDLKLEYTGNPLKPEITITDTRRDAEGNFIVTREAEAPEEPGDSEEPGELEDHYRLVEDKDYLLQWSANQYPGRAEVTIVGIGNYEGTIVDNFTIFVDLKDVTIEPIPVQHYTEEGFPEPELTVTLGETTLILNQDYSVKYEYNEDHPDRGEATAKISSVKGQEYYIGSNSATFMILRSLAEAEIILPHNLFDEELMGQEILYTYTGSPVQPKAVVRFNDEDLDPEEDYEISYTNNINVGTANVIVTGKGTFEGSSSTTFDISNRNVTRCSFSAVSDVMYDGSQTSQNLVVSDGEKTLEAGKDYRLEYINNVNPGIATIKVTGIGNYSGVKTIHYLILLNSMAQISAQGAADSVSLTWTPVFGAEGYEIYNENNILIAKTAELSYTHTDLDAITTYQYKIRPYMSSDGAIYYGGFSNLVQVQTSIQKPVITLKAKKKAAVVSWKKIKGVSGYEIYRSTKKKKGYKKIKTAKKAAIVKYTNKKLTKKKKYYYKIRAYKIVDGKKVYSSYSSPKSVKAK